MPYVVEITGYNIAAAAEQTLRFAVGPGIAFTDTTMAPSGVVSWASPTQKIGVNKAGAIDLTGDGGTLVLANYPNDLFSPGPLDALATGWVWLGRRANFYYIPGRAYSARTIIATGILEQPVATLSQDSSLQSTINFPLRDPRSLLDRPLQPTKYLGQRENLLLWSQEIDNASWVKSNAPVVANAAVAPDGTLTAEKVNENTTNAAHYAEQYATVVAGVPYTASVFLKAGERNYATVLISANDGVHYHGTIVDLAGGASTSVDAGGMSGTDHGIMYVGNGWWRVWATAISPGTTFGLQVQIGNATPVFIYAGTTGFGLNMWGAQLAYGTGPKAYAVTTSALVNQSDVEGDADVKGKVKPIVYGTCSNIPGVRVSLSKLIWQAADRAATIMCVRDGGASLTLGVIRGSLASLLSTTPNPGTYDTYAGSEGTFLRLGSKPQKGIAMDVQEAPSRTNLVFRSQEIDNAAWTKSNATITPNATTAPDGTATADKLCETATATVSHSVNNATGVALTVGAAFTASVYVKAAERGQAVVQIYDGTNNSYIAVNLATGAIDVSSLTGAFSDALFTVTDAGSGWWRVSASDLCAISPVYLFVYPSIAGNVTYTGTAGSGIYVWGAQVEAGPVVTAYIATAATAVTVFDEGGRTHGQVWARLRVERCGNVPYDLAPASVAAADTLDPHEVGFYFDDDGTTQLDAVNAVLTSFSAYEVQGFDLKWSIAKLVAPSGATVLDLRIVSPTTNMDSNDRALRAFTKVRPTFAPDGAPPYRVNVQWGRNNSIMSDGDFVGVTSERLRSKFLTEWRVETAVDNSIWNPLTLTGPWTNAPELTIDTGYQPGPDGLTCPHAATEAARALALYSALPGQYQVGYIAEVTDQILPGVVVSLTHPQMGLTGGPLFRVLQSSLVVDANGVKTDLVIGFQT